MSLLLTLEGFTVYAAATGTEAMRLFREIQPAFVLLDIGLPDIDGHSVARSIRTLQSDVRPTIIAITGWGAERDRKLSREAGCDAHLTKPIDFDELASLLNQPSIPLCKIANDDQ
jgi:two-component system CheB/CheR fusion protein